MIELDIKTSKLLYRKPLNKLECPELLTDGCDRVKGFERLIKAAGCIWGVEVGVREARMSKALFYNCGLKFVHGIDIKDCGEGRELERNFNWCYKFHVGDSLSMSQKWPDGWFDFVHLDSDHHYNHVKKELRAWWPKVRVGGILSGDDFIKYDDQQEGTFGVVDAVTEWAKHEGLCVRLINCNSLDPNIQYHIADTQGIELTKKNHGKKHHFEYVPNWYVIKENVNGK